MVWSPRHVIGRAGWGMEEKHERRSREAWIHVLPTLAHGACLACGLDERHNPCQLFGQPRVLAGSNDKRVYASRMAATFAAPRAGHQGDPGNRGGLSQSRRARKSRGF